MSDLDKEQSNYFHSAHGSLKLAEKLIDLGIELKTASKHLNWAAADIRALERLWKNRRGGPRRLLRVQINYLGAWQSALVAIKEKRANKSSEAADRLFKMAVQVSSRLPLEAHPDSAKFVDLVKKIERWQDE